jgi:hydrogenase maturation protease
MSHNGRMQVRVSEPHPRVLILGVGNLLLTDDGLGVHVINSLKESVFPKNVTLLEAGTVSHQLITELHKVDLLIVVDVVEAGDVPGAIFKFSPDDLHYTSVQRTSLHQISLIDVLQMTELTGKKPKTIIIAVQPKDVSSWSLELSPEVKAIIPKVKELIFEELKQAAACS